MDGNKLEKLRAIEYAINKACGNCAFGNFRETGSFGDCHQFHYRHLKHSGDLRYLSVNRYGVCPEWQRGDNLTKEWEEFRHE